MRFRFDVAFLIKSFNRLNIDEKQKILKNLLHTLKPNGQVFVYESEWTKDKGEKISIQK
jgi:hypothetical protein